ncbi:MAG: glycosyltransferase [Anaerolineales bacterium]
MRIAMLAYHTCPLATLGGKNTGGMNVYVRDLTRQLGKMGVHVDVFTRSQDEHVPHVLHDLGYGNRIVHVPAGPEFPLPKRELASYLPDFVSGVQDFVTRKRLKYDLLHSHYWMSGIAARDLKAVWGIPIIHMFHTLGIMKRRVARDDSEVEGDYRLEGERDVINLADWIIAATPAELAQLQWLYNAETERISVIPPGVDVNHFYPIDPDEAKEYIGIPPNDQMLLFVGRVEPLKGIDTLIRAIALMREMGLLERHRLCLSIIGGDPDPDSAATNTEMVRLKELREDNDLEDIITFLGRRSQDTLPYYYSASEAVVMPSHYESFGMVALEAMACGTPVVASEVGGLAFLIQDEVTGYHVPVGEPEALCDRLSLLLEDRNLHERMSKDAVIFSQEYAWENIAAKIVELYQKLMNNL